MLRYCTSDIEVSHHDVFSFGCDSTALTALTLTGNTLGKQVVGGSLWTYKIFRYC
jgi:hypothetical protein